MPVRESEARLDDDPLFAEGEKGRLFPEEKVRGGEARERVAGAKPDFRVVQPEYVPALGKSVYKDVGAMWRNVSKSGNEFYTMKIGKLKLLVFPNIQPRSAAVSPGDALPKNRD